MELGYGSVSAMENGVSIQKKRRIAYAVLDIDEISMAGHLIDEDPDLPLLAASIVKHGLLQPVVVCRNDEGGRYALVCGARRIRACKMAGITQIDAVILAGSRAQCAAWYQEDHILRRTPGIAAQTMMIRRGGFEETAQCSALPMAMIRSRSRWLALPERVRAFIQKQGLTFEQSECLTGIQGDLRQIEAASIIAQRALGEKQARRLVYGSERDKRRGRRRKHALIMETVSMTVERMRAIGVDACVYVHQTEDGMNIQFMIKVAGSQNEKAGNECKREK